MCQHWGTFKFHNFEAFKNCAGHVLFPDALLKTKNEQKTQPCNQKVNDNQRSQPRKISDWHCLLSWTPGQIKPRNLNGRSLRSVSSCFLVLPFVPRKPIIIQCTYMALIYGIVSVHSWTPFFLTTRLYKMSGIVAKTNLKPCQVSMPQHATAVVTRNSITHHVVLLSWPVVKLPSIVSVGNFTLQKFKTPIFSLIKARK